MTRKDQLIDDLQKLATSEEERLGKEKPMADDPGRACLLAGDCPPQRSINSVRLGPLIGPMSQPEPKYVATRK